MKFSPPIAAVAAVSRTMDSRTGIFPAKNWLHGAHAVKGGGGGLCVVCGGVCGSGGVGGELVFHDTSIKKLKKT